MRGCLLLSPSKVTGSLMEAKKYIYVVQVTRQLSIDIINEFAAEGCRITLLTGSVEKQYSGLHPSVKVKLFNRYRNTSFTGRIVSGLWFHLQCFFFILFKAGNRELILISTPPFLPFLGLFFYRLRKQKYHLLIWDLYPDVLLRMKKIKAGSLLYKLWSKRNASLFKNCTSLITLSRQMAVLISGYTDKKPEVIPPWGNPSYLHAVNKSDNLFLKTHGLSDELIVMYAGNLGITHPVEVIIKTAALLKHDSRLKFIIIGEGEKKNKIRQMKEEEQLGNVLLLPYQNADMFFQAITAAQVAVITLSSHAGDVSLPSKTFSALAAGSALLVIGPEHSVLGEMVKQYHCGEIYAENDVSSIAGFLVSLAANPQKLNEYRQHALKAADDFTPANARLYYRIICNYP
jgi:glycosyltransferase involved in cell wall biosynthesis